MADSLSNQFFQWRAFLPPSVSCAAGTSALDVGETPLSCRSPGSFWGPPCPRENPGEWSADAENCPFRDDLGRK